MKIGSADLYANHPIIVVGSSDKVDDPVPLNEEAAVASGTHVSIATRGQAGLVRVSLWNVVGPRTGEVVFDGDLTLVNNAVAVFDVEGLSRFSAPVGAGDRHRLVIRVDDPGLASRIDVIIDCGSDVRALTAVPGLRLFDVSIPAGVELGPSDELALILSGHDLPMNRLAAAIKLMMETPAARPAIRLFWIRMLVEWTRWLSPWQSLAGSREIGTLVQDRLPGQPTDSADVAAAELASEILRRIR